MEPNSVTSPLPLLKLSATIFESTSKPTLMSYVHGSTELHGTISKLLHPETNESLLYASCTYHPGQKDD